MADVFSHLKVSDKIIVMFNAADSSSSEAALDSMYQASDRLGELLEDKDGSIDKYIGQIGQADASEMIGFILDHLPVFMEDADY